LPTTILDKQLAKYSDIYRRPIDLFREAARRERIAMREEAIGAMYELLPLSIPRPLDLCHALEEPLEFGTEVGRGGYRFQIVDFMGKNRPVLFHPETTIEELVTQLAGPPLSDE
jgi:hypothetical protein